MRQSFRPPQKRADKRRRASISTRCSLREFGLNRGIGDHVFIGRESSKLGFVPVLPISRGARQNEDSGSNYAGAPEELRKLGKIDLAVFAGTPSRDGPRFKTVRDFAGDWLGRISG